MKVIFLDIDGVLVNLPALQAGRVDDGHCRAAPECVRWLNWITDQTGARIIVSSNWRKFHTLPALRTRLHSWGVTAPILGATPDLSEKRAVYVAVPRGLEIEAALRARPQIERFAILDDDADMTGLKGQLVQTRYETGLTEADARRCVELLA